MFIIIKFNPMDYRLGSKLAQKVLSKQQNLEDIRLFMEYKNRVDQARDEKEKKELENTGRELQNINENDEEDKDDEEIVFNVSNNYQSSSILEFGTHSIEHPYIVYVDKIHQKSITIDTFFERNNIDASKYNFWNFDIQGAELIALKGSIQSIKYASVLYLEVNEKELYKNCGLISDIDSFLSKYNFKRILTSMTSHGWGDALYITTKS